MKILITATLITYLLTIPFVTMAEQSQQESQRTEQQNETYLQHLKYEYGNRGRTFIGMSKAAKHAAGSERANFFQAYYELEVINQNILNHIKGELGVDYEANWLTHSAINVMTYLGWRFVSPQQLIDVIIPYLPKLQEMESLASTKHKAFFAYIVAQEQAQLDASLAAKNKNWDSGAKVLIEFLPQAEAELQRLLSSAN